MHNRWSWMTAVVLLAFCVPAVAAGSVTGSGTAWAVWGSNGVPGVGVVALGTAEEVELTFFARTGGSEGDPASVWEVSFAGARSKGTCTATGVEGAASVTGDFRWLDRTWSCSDIQVDPGELDVYDPCHWTVTVEGRSLTGLPVDEVSAAFDWVSCTASGA